MQKKIYSFIIGINLLQSFLCLVTFVNWVQQTTTGSSFMNLYDWNLFSIFYWSIMAVLVVVGLSLSVFCLVSKKSDTAIVGFVLSIIGYSSMIFFIFFLIVPATLLLLGAIFIYLMNIKESTM